MSHLVVVSRVSRHARLAREIELAGHKVTFISNNDELLGGHWKANAPEYLFFLHWSEKIPPEIYESHSCVIFHMADLPNGRGGSPLQNLIVSGYEQTTLCALCCVAEMDAGPVYLRRPLSLAGTANDILERAADLMVPMILEIAQTDPLPEPQKGVPVVFKRRTRSDGNLAALKEIRQVFDYIRMLDSEEYPCAYLETEMLLFEFSKATLVDGHVMANVRVKLRKP